MKEILKQMKEKVGEASYGEILEKVIKLGSAEEVVDLLKEYGVNIPLDEAKAFIEEVTGGMEISIDSLEKVAGGVKYF